MNETFDTIANAIAALRAELDARAAQLEAAAESQRQSEATWAASSNEAQTLHAQEVARLQNEIANMPQQEANLIAQLRVERDAAVAAYNELQARIDAAQGQA